MRNYFNKKADHIIINKIFSEHKLITVEPGKCRFNFRCWNNAVNDAIKKGDKKLAMVVYLDGSCPIVHFINYRNGKYIDNTLGHWCTRHEYYFIKFLPKEEFFTVYQLFASYRKTLRNYLPFWLRVLSNNTF